MKLTTKKWLLIWLMILPAAILAQDAVPESPFDQVIQELDFKNTDLKDVARLLARKYRLNLFVADDVNVRVTIHLQNVTVESALTFIVEQYNLRLDESGDILKISPQPQPEPPPKVFAIDVVDGILSTDIHDEDLHAVLGVISEKLGKTVIADRGVAGTLSGKISNMPFETGLALLLRTNGFQMQKANDAYLVRRLRASPSKDAASGNLWVQVRDSKIDLDVYQAPLAEVLNELSMQTGIDFFLLGNPKGAVTARASNLTTSEALDYLLLGSPWSYRKNDSIFLIGDKNDKNLVSSELLELDHIKVGGVTELLPKKVTDKAELIVVPEHNALLVNASPDLIHEISAIVETLDKPIPQIFFEALVVDFTHSDTYELGIEAGLNNSDTTRGKTDFWIPGVDVLWNAANSNKYLGKLGDALGGVNIGMLPDDFYLKIKALEQVGRANIMSRPQISTLNGHTAELTIGETRYFKLVSQTPLRDPSQVYIQTSERFQSVEINISLKITPWVSASGEITVEIYPEFNTPGEQISIEVPPNIQSRALSSTVRLRDGETIILGGLIQEIDSENSSRVPILGSIPLLGRLFSSTSHTKAKSELIIYVTPHLTYSDSWMEGI